MPVYVMYVTFGVSKENYIHVYQPKHFSTRRLIVFYQYPFSYNSQKVTKADVSSKEMFKMNRFEAQYHV